MSILEEVLNTFGFISQSQFEARIAEAVKAELDKVPRWLGETADAQRNSQPDPIIYANQADLYRLSPILGTALDVLADDVGLSKFNVKRMVGEEVRDINNHDFELLLRAPNPLETGMEFLGSTTRGYKLNGNHVWWLNRGDPFEPPQELWEIPYQMIQPVPDGKLYLSHYNYLPGNAKQAMPLPTWQIVHFKTYNPNNRFVGLSPIESLAQTLIGDLGMRKTNTRTYTEYGGAPQSILAFKDWVPDEAWKDIKQSKQQAAMKNEMMMLRGVGDGVTWMARAMSSKDMEFIETLKHNMTDVFNRMCPGLLSMLSENATEANALAARATYSEKSLWKTLEAIAQKVTADILPSYGRKLIGIFDDPRVVDRKLELEEQNAFERTHTVEEVRQEYYQDDPIGDERDKLFVVQVNEQSGGIQKPPPPPRPIMPTPLNTQPAEETPVTDNGAPDLQAKAAIEDLQRWKKMAIRGKTEKMIAFKSIYIPSAMSRDISMKLGILTDKAQIVALFDAKIESFKPKPRRDPDAVLEGIRLGLKALTLSK
jgi:phage portal protein BeeE